MPNDDAPRKLTHAQANAEHHLYQSTKTIEKRLEACTAITRRLYAMRGIDLDDFKTDLTPSRAPRRPR